MVTYISMLRGINVSGRKKIKMEELTALFEFLGLKNVKTYVQSGNVIFNSPQRDTRELSNLIEEKIKRVSKLSVSVLLRTLDELQQIINNNPFLKEKGVDSSKLHITFLSEVPKELGLSKVIGLYGELYKFVIINREVYLYCPDGYGRTKFSNDFFERKLGVTATTRNWKTVNALLDIAKKQA